MSFHGCDHGANIDIVVGDSVQSLSPEVSPRPSRDEECGGPAAIAEGFSISDADPSTLPYAPMLSPGHVGSTRPLPKLVSSDILPLSLKRFHVEWRQKYVGDHTQSISVAPAVDVKQACLVYLRRAKWMRKQLVELFAGLVTEIEQARFRWIE